MRPAADRMAAPGAIDLPIRRGRAADQGFTLVELVIALALIGLITLLLFAGLRLGTRAWEGVERTADRTAELRVARNFLERALVQSRTASLVIAGEPVPVFSGDAETLEFVTPLSEHVGIPGLYVLRLGLQGGRERQLLLTRWLLNPDVLAGGGDIPEWAPFDGVSAPSAPSGPLDDDVASGAFGTSLLVENVEEMEIAYFGRKAGDEEADWYEDWLEQREPPVAVRMRLTTAEQTWPDMLIRLPDVRQ